MKKYNINNLLAVLLLVGFANFALGASQASGAFTSKEERRIKNLEASISLLQGAVTDLSAQLIEIKAKSSGSNYLEVSKYSELKIPFLTEVGFLSNCPTGTGQISLFAKQYPIGQDSSGFAAKMTTCAATFLVKK